MKVEDSHLTHLSLALAAASLVVHFILANRQLFETARNQIFIAPIIASLALMAAAYAWLATKKVTAWHRITLAVATLTLLFTGGFTGIFFLAHYILS